MKIRGFGVMLILHGIRAMVVFNDIGIISRSFDFELTKETQFDLIFCGEFIALQSINETFAEHFHLAKWPLEWLLNTSMHNTLNLSTRDHPTLFFFAPVTEQLLFDLIEKIGSLHSTKTITRPSTNRRIFFIPWPSELNCTNVLFSLRNSTALLQHALHIRQDVEVYIILWTTDDTGRQFVTDIVEVFSIRSTVPVVQLISRSDLNSFINDVGIFQIDTDDLLQISVRRNDFQGVLFNVLAQDDFYKPEVDVRKLENGSVYFDSGSSLQVFYDLMLTLNLTYQPVDGKGWTKLVNDSNGETLSGIGQQIMNFEADLSISTSTMEFYRSKFVSFLQPIGSEQSFVFFRQPSISAARNIFMMPFQLDLWYSVLAAWAVIMVCGFLVACRNVQLLGHTGTSRMHSRYVPCQECFHWYDAYIWTIAAACQQGWFGCPSQLPVRLLFITGLFANLIIYAYYTAAFVAAISAPTTPIKTYSDLIKTQFQVIVNPSDPGFILSFTKGDDENLYNKILETSKKLYTDDVDMVNQIMLSNEKIATIIGQDGFYSVGLESYNVSQLCEVDKKKGNDGPKVKDAMMIRKESPYKEFFQHSTIMLIERGLTKRSWITYEINTQIRCLQNTTQIFGLNFLDCYSAFAILFMGEALACCWALFERHRKHRFVLSSSWF